MRSSRGKPVADGSRLKANITVDIETDIGGMGH